MLDENLPTFHFKPSADNPHSNILYLSQHGSDPTPEYILKRADPSQPSGRNKYATALCSSVSSDIIYAEIVVEPEWTQPTLSAAELRAQGGVTPPPVPVVPESFSVMLYNPDQTVSFKLASGSWGKSDSWEFEMPTQTFKMPSASALDRQAGTSAADVVPRITFRWKKDGRLTKDMTCYMTGKSLGGKKSKEPDITVALFKAGKESSVTIYQPNLQRVEIEDMKGFEVVLLLAAEAIRDLYLAPRQDIFNTAGSAPGAVVNTSSRKKETRTGGAASSPTGATMSGALGNIPPSSNSTPGAANNTAPGPSSSSAAAASDAETRRLKAIVEREEREREKRDKAEQKRIKKMLEEEDKERRRREAEVAKETERLRKMYGTQGQDLPSSTRTAASPPLPPRPLSVGPGMHSGPPNGYGPPVNGQWRGPGSPPYLQPGPGPGWIGGGGGGLNVHHPGSGGSMSNFFGLNRSDDGGRRVQKKRSSHW